MKAVPFRLILSAATIETLLIGIRLLSSPASHIVEAIAILLLTSSVYIAAVYCITNHQETCLDPAKVSARQTAPIGGLPWTSTQKFILVAAFVFRCTVFPVFPSLSDDLYRYRWEGKLQAYGGNPYQSRPIDPQWSVLRDSTWANVGSKDFKGIYGPLMLLEERAVYAILSRLPDPFAQVFWFKLPAILADIGLMAAVAMLLRARGLPLERILIYAWCPLPIVEYWMEGHNDAIVVLFIVVALVAAAKERWSWSFAALSLAIVAKIWPAMLLPAFLWRSRRAGKTEWAWSLLVIPMGALLAIPFWSRVIENAQFASGFVGGWRNNDSLFGALLWITDGDLHSAKYLAFGLIALFGGAIALSRMGLEKAVLATILVILFLSGNCHAWYLTWFLPLLTLFPFPPILLWTAVMPLSYSVLIGWKTLGEWNGSTPLRWLIYVPVFAMFLVSGCTEFVHFRRQSARPSHLDPMAERH